MSARRISLVVVSAAICVTAAPLPARAAFPGRNGRIAYEFRSYDPATGISEDDIRDVAPNGMGDRLLRGCREMQETAISGDCSIFYFDPAFSADGTRIVFNAGASLARMNSNGGSLHRIPNHAQSSFEPAWSPGGSRIVFSGRSASGHVGLYTEDPSGDHLRKLIGAGGKPAWSTRGLIAFERGTSRSQRDIFVVRADGRAVRRVTRAGGGQPAWSPHGTKLAFVRHRTGFIVGADGRGLRPLTTQGLDVRTLAWSPDGRQIAFQSDKGGGIFVEDMDGGNMHRVAASGSSSAKPATATAPDWQPVR